MPLRWSTSCSNAWPNNSSAFNLMVFEVWSSAPKVTSIDLVMVPL